MFLINSLTIELLIKEVLADVKRKTVSIFESSLFVLAIAFSNSKSPLFRTPLTIKFASTFLQKSIVRLADEKNTDVNEMSSIIVTKDSEANKVYMLAYHNNEFYKQVSFNWLFNNPEEVLGEVG